MAKPLPNEKELYERIKNEQISLNPDIWDLLYHRIGDDVTAINLLCQYYFTNNEPIAIEEAKKILSYTRHIKDIIHKITITEKDEFPFPEFLENIPLHPILREMFTHYIGNDVYIINLIVQDSVDPLDPHPVAVENTQKILNHTHSIKEFINRLREATSPQDNSLQLQAISNNARGLSGDNKKGIGKKELFFRIRKLLASEFNMNEERIKSESRFNEDLGLDSVDAIQVVMALEAEFDFEIPDEAAEKVFTVGQAVDYVFAKLKEES